MQFYSKNTVLARRLPVEPVEEPDLKPKKKKKRMAAAWVKRVAAYTKNDINIETK